MKIHVIAAAVGTAMLLAGCAPEQQQVNIRANQATTVGFIATTSVGCADHAPPRPTVATPPQSGTVAFGVGKTKLNNPESACNGVSMIGAYTTYAPNKGFQGQDRFTVRYVFDSDDSGGTANRAIEYIVNVK